MKGDVSGMAEPGEANDKVTARIEQLKASWDPHPSPVELLTLSGDPAKGVPVWASVSEFGAQLLAKVLDLNEVQTSVLSLVFHYADANGLLLVDLKDLREVLRFLGTEEGQQAVADLGGVAKPTLGVLLRKLVELEEQGVAGLFGEPAFDVNDLLRTDPAGRGVVTLLELADVADRPRVFSTFMMWLLAELFETLPEVGDLDKPKLVFFFDEAHLLFDGASKAFVEQVQRTVRPIRSKGGRGVLHHPAPPGPARRGPGPARQPGPACPAGDHPQGRRRDRQDGPDLPDDRGLRPCVGPDLPGCRRGGGDRPLPRRRPHPGRLDPPLSTPVPHGPSRPGNARAGGDRRVDGAWPVRAGGGSGERLRAADREAPAGRGREADPTARTIRPRPSTEPARRAPAPKDGVDTHDLVQMGKMASSGS